MPGIRVAFDLPFALYLNPGRAFEFTVEDRRVAVQLQDQRFTEMTRYGKGDGWELKNDKAGTFRYSRFFLEFHAKDDMEREEAVDFAHRVANRLIEVYRQVTSRAYLEPLRKHQIINPLVFLEQPNGQWAGTQAIVFPKGAGPARPYDPEDVQSQVFDWLRTDRPIHLHEVLMLNAKDCLEREDYRSCLMEALSSVEVFVDQLLRSTYRAWGWSEMRIGKHLVSGRNWQITDRIKNLVGEISGRNVSWNADIWQPWLEGKRMRDRVVHSGLVLDHRDEKSVAAAVSACERLIAHVKSLPRHEQEPLKSTGGLHSSLNSAGNVKL